MHLRASCWSRDARGDWPTCSAGSAPPKARHSEYRRCGCRVVARAEKRSHKNNNENQSCYCRDGERWLSDRVGRRRRADWAQDDLERASRCTMRRGEFVALLGANGSGKSTLLKVLLGALPLAAGADRGARPPARRGRARDRLPAAASLVRRGTRLRGLDIVRLGLDGDRWGLPLPLAVGRPRGAQARGARARGRGDRAGRRRRLRGAPDRRALGRRAAAAADRAGARAPPASCCCSTSRSTASTCPTRPSVAALVASVCRAAGVATLLVAHDVNPLLPYLDRVVYLAGGHAVEGPVERGHHDGDAERACTACPSRCCAPPTGASSSSGSRSRRPTTTTATSTTHAHGTARARACRLTRSTRR